MPRRYSIQQRFLPKCSVYVSVPPVPDFTFSFGLDDQPEASSVSIMSCMTFHEARVVLLLHFHEFSGVFLNSDFDSTDVWIWRNLPGALYSSSKHRRYGSLWAGKYFWMNFDFRFIVLIGDPDDFLLLWGENDEATPSKRLS